MNPPSPDSDSESQIPDIVGLQIEAYNRRDVEAFVGTYAPDAEIFRLPGKEPWLKGEHAIRERYGAMFAASPELHCNVAQRWEAGSFVALLEEVSGMAGRGAVECIAIYEVQNGLIQRLWLGS